jgi:hypothetical protein
MSEATAGDGGPEAGPAGRLRAGLYWLREGPRADQLTALAFLVGVALGAVHWVGLFVGGALVGLVAPSFTRAVQHGLYLGVLVLGLFVAYLWVYGGLGTYLGLGQLLYANVAITLLVPPLGATLRGLG